MSVRLDRFVEAMPRGLRTITDQIIRDPRSEPAIRAMLERADEFPSRRVAVLSAIYNEPTAREAWDQYLASLFRAGLGQLPSRAYTVIVGSGPHAAIFAAGQVKAGKGIPIVLERESVAGGVMATAPGPAFWLNSRNRPGPLGVPGDFDTSLMELPGCELQPYHLGGGEYQTNHELAWCVRANLALLGVTVYVNTAATTVNTGEVYYRAYGGPERRMLVDRIVVCSGLGKEKTLTGPERLNGQAAFTGMKWMRHFTDRPFPMQGMEKVAVIGAGDMGRCVVESLVGMGPQHPGSQMDWVREVDWYGQSLLTCAVYRSNTRSRYQGLSRWFPEGDRKGRIRPRDARPLRLDGSYRGVTIMGSYYDAAIVCIGWEPQLLEGVNELNTWTGTPGSSQGRRLGRFFESGSGSGRYLLGPAARLPITDSERAYLPGVFDVPGNVDALFRYADRTAYAAQIL